MRGAFVKTLVDLAEQDPRLVFLTGDLGYTVVEPFAEKFPERFYNVGVAEQNMIGIATGLAEAGFIPFVYSIAPFAALRPYEFIRNGPILHQLPVRIVGIGGGFEYGSAGPTHFGLEDLGVMRIQPGMTIIAPADHAQTRTALLTTWELPGPIYYRLGKDDKNTIPGLDGRFELDRTQTLGEGNDLLFVATGSIVSEVMATVETLAVQGLTCQIIIVPCLSPAPTADLVESLSKFPLVVTVEEHYVTGGLGSLISEIVTEHNLGCRVIRCGVNTLPESRSGSQHYLRQVHGLSSDMLVETVNRELNLSEVIV